MSTVGKAYFEKKGLPMMDSPTISSAGMFNKLSLPLPRRGNRSPSCASSQWPKQPLWNLKFQSIESSKIILYKSG